MEQLVNRLKNGLSQPLPGIQAQYLMAPMFRERIKPEELKEGQYRPSAVMILFCEDEDGTIFIPLTERMSYQGVHSAQISLPGGKFEPSDETLMNTAIRECYEEIGIKDLDVIGKLTQLFIPVSGFLVQPYIGVCKTKNPQMINQLREVKTILKLKLDAFLSENIIREGVIEMPGNLKINTRWFEVEGLKVWGATAMILSELKELMKAIS